jgi:hypothetical protein
MTSHILKMCCRDTRTIKFVKLYESEPILWDSTLKNYKSHGSTCIDKIQKIKKFFLTKTKKIIKTKSLGVQQMKLTPPK